MTFVSLIVMSKKIDVNLKISAVHLLHWPWGLHWASCFCSGNPWCWWWLWRSINHEDYDDHDESSMSLTWCSEQAGGAATPHDHEDKNNDDANNDNDLHDGEHQDDIDDDNDFQNKRVMQHTAGEKRQSAHPDHSYLRYKRWDNCPRYFLLFIFYLRYKRWTICPLYLFFHTFCLRNKRWNMCLIYIFFHIFYLRYRWWDIRLHISDTPVN